jgi:hypothetical protein
VGRLAVALFLGFFALLAAGAIAAQVYGLTGLHERRERKGGTATPERERP